MTVRTNKRKEPTALKYHAYHLVEPTGESQKVRWHRIGAVVAHDDGEGETLILDSLPLHFSGRIVMRAPKREQGAGQ